MEWMYNRKTRGISPTCMSLSLLIEIRLMGRLTDQIEFANVILLNKTDIMPAETIDRIETIVTTLNP
jgi:G3E family GTPase